MHILSVSLTGFLFRETTSDQASNTQRFGGSFVVSLDKPLNKQLIGRWNVPSP